MKKVTNITEEQKSKLAEYVKKWTAIGLSTEPANRIEAEKYINIAYENAGLNPPEKIIWCGSPLSQALTRAIILHKKIFPPMGNRVLPYIFGDAINLVIDSVVSSVEELLWDTVKNSLCNPIFNSVNNYVFNHVSYSLMDFSFGCIKGKTLASIRDSIQDFVGFNITDSVWGDMVVFEDLSVEVYLKNLIMDTEHCQHYTNWFAFYEFFRNECGLIDETEKLTGPIGIAKNAGWFLPHEKICFVSERPNVLNLNENGKLHCLDGPALSYPDGWCIYAKNGVIVSNLEFNDK